MIKLDKACVTFSLIAGMSWGALAQADIFAGADKLYRKRADGYNAATEARKAYGSLLDQVRGDDFVYAVAQMSRLDIYRGAMVPGVDVGLRKQALDECLANVDSIRSTRKQEYYYFYTACLGFRGKLAGTLERVSYALKMSRIQDEALNSTRNSAGKLVGGYEGGGILRVMSALRGNRQAKPLGLYNPQEAVAYAEIALNTPKRQDPAFPEPLSGRDYFENSYYKAQALVTLGIEENDLSKVNAGHTLLENTISELDDLEAIDSLPKGREPETAYHKGLMAKLNGDVERCKGSSDWKTCLTDTLN